MKLLQIIIVILSIVLSKSVIAGQAEYDDCILKHLKGAKVDVATHLIKQACEENYKSPSFISEKKRAYNSCLLEHLTKVESIQAVMAIRSACDSKYR